jgi:hypothetical protein
VAGQINSDLFFRKRLLVEKPNEFSRARKKEIL